MVAFYSQLQPFLLQPVTSDCQKEPSRNHPDNSYQKTRGLAPNELMQACRGDEKKNATEYNTYGADWRQVHR